MVLPFRMPLRPFAEISRTTILIFPILGGGVKCLVTHFLHVSLENPVISCKKDRSFEEISDFHSIEIHDY